MQPILLSLLVLGSVFSDRVVIYGDAELSGENFLQDLL